MRGVVKFFDEGRGFGFICPDDGSEDVFIHISQLAGQRLSIKDQVEYDVGDNPRNGRSMATNIKVLSSAARSAAHVVFGG